MAASSDSAVDRRAARVGVGAGQIEHIAAQLVQAHGARDGAAIGEIAAAGVDPEHGPDSEAPAVGSQQGAEVVGRGGVPLSAPAHGHCERRTAGHGHFAGDVVLRQRGGAGRFEHSRTDGRAARVGVGAGERQRIRADLEQPQRAAAGIGNVSGVGPSAGRGVEAQARAGGKVAGGKHGRDTGIAHRIAHHQRRAAGDRVAARAVPTRQRIRARDGQHATVDRRAARVAVRAGKGQQSRSGLEQRERAGAVLQRAGKGTGVLWFTLKVLLLSA